MGNRISASFEVKNWDEAPFDERSDDSKVTRAVVVKQYQGDIKGTSTTEWLMAYAQDGTASFIGLERVVGLIGGKNGTLVLRHIGSYEDGSAKAALDVIEGSGSGELQHAKGRGEFLADPSGSIVLDLEVA